MKETMHYEAAEELEHGQSTIPQMAVRISDLEIAMAEFLELSSPRPEAVQSSPSASTRKSARKSKIGENEQRLFRWRIRADRDERNEDIYKAQKRKRRFWGSG